MTALIPGSPTCFDPGDLLDWQAAMIEVQS